VAPSITDLSQHRIQAGESHFVFVHGTGLEHVTAAQVGDTAVDHRVDGTGDNATVTLTIPDDFPPGNHWVVVTAGNERSDCVDGSQALEVLAPGGGDDDHLVPELTGIVPEEIVLGEDADYWLIGSGLTSVIAVMSGNDAFRFEGYDDSRLRVSIGAAFHADPGAEVVFEVHGAHGQPATLSVPTRGRPAETEPGLLVLSVEPDVLGPDGGAITVRGGYFKYDTEVFLGPVECTDVDVVDEGILRATAPSLAEHVGEALTVLIRSPAHNEGAFATNNPVTVTVAPE
jgi:hypothetical protein